MNKKILKLVLAAALSLCSFSAAQNTSAMDDQNKINLSNADQSETNNLTFSVNASPIIYKNSLKNVEKDFLNHALTNLKKGIKLYYNDNCDYKLRKPMPDYNKYKDQEYIHKNERVDEFLGFLYTEIMNIFSNNVVSYNTYSKAREIMKEFVSNCRKTLGDANLSKKVEDIRPTQALFDEQINNLFSLIAKKLNLDDDPKNTAENIVFKFDNPSNNPIVFTPIKNVDEFNKYLDQLLNEVLQIDHLGSKSLYGYLEKIRNRIVAMLVSENCFEDHIINSVIRTINFFIYYNVVGVVAYEGHNRVSNDPNHLWRYTHNRDRLISDLYEVFGQKSISKAWSSGYKENVKALFNKIKNVLNMEETPTNTNSFLISDDEKKVIAECLYESNEKIKKNYKQYAKDFKSHKASEYIAAHRSLHEKIGDEIKGSFHEIKNQELRQKIEAMINCVLTYSLDTDVFSIKQYIERLPQSESEKPIRFITEKYFNCKIDRIFDDIAKKLGVTLEKINLKDYENISFKKFIDSSDKLFDKEKNSLKNALIKNYNTLIENYEKHDNIAKENVNHFLKNIRARLRDFSKLGEIGTTKEFMFEDESYYNQFKSEIVLNEFENFKKRINEEAITNATINTELNKKLLEQINIKDFLNKKDYIFEIKRLINNIAKALGVTLSENDLSMPIKSMAKTIDKNLKSKISRNIDMNDVISNLMSRDKQFLDHFSKDENLGHGNLIRRIIENFSKMLNIDDLNTSIKRDITNQILEKSEILTKQRQAGDADSLKEFCYNVVEKFCEKINELYAKLNGDQPTNKQLLLPAKIQEEKYVRYIIVINDQQKLVNFIKFLNSVNEIDEINKNTAEQKEKTNNPNPSNKTFGVNTKPFIKSGIFNTNKLNNIEINKKKSLNSSDEFKISNDQLKEICINEMLKNIFFYSDLYDTYTIKEAITLFVGRISEQIKRGFLLDYDINSLMFLTKNDDIETVCKVITNKILDFLNKKYNLSPSTIIKNVFSKEECEKFFNNVVNLYFEIFEEIYKHQLLNAEQIKFLKNVGLNLEEFKTKFFKDAKEEIKTKFFKDAIPAEKIKLNNDERTELIKSLNNLGNKIANNYETYKAQTFDGFSRGLNSIVNNMIKNNAVEDCIRLIRENFYLDFLPTEPKIPYPQYKPMNTILNGKLFKEKINKLFDLFNKFISEYTFSSSGELNKEKVDVSKEASLIQGATLTADKKLIESLAKFKMENNKFNEIINKLKKDYPYVIFSDDSIERFINSYVVDMTNQIRKCLLNSNIDTNDIFFLTQTGEQLTINSVIKYKMLHSLEKNYNISPNAYIKDTVSKEDFEKFSHNIADLYFEMFNIICGCQILENDQVDFLKKSSLNLKSPESLEKTDNNNSDKKAELKKEKTNSLDQSLSALNNAFIGGSINTTSIIQNDNNSLNKTFIGNTNPLNKSASLSANELNNIKINESILAASQPQTPNEPIVLNLNDVNKKAELKEEKINIPDQVSAQPSSNNLVANQTYANFKKELNDIAIFDELNKEKTNVPKQVSVEPSSNNLNADKLKPLEKPDLNLEPNNTYENIEALIETIKQNDSDQLQPEPNGPVVDLDKFINKAVEEAEKTFNPEKKSTLNLLFHMSFSLFLKFLTKTLVNENEKILKNKNILKNLEDLKIHDKRKTAVAFKNNILKSLDLYDDDNKKIKEFIKNELSTKEGREKFYYKLSLKYFEELKNILGSALLNDEQINFLKDKSN